MRRAAAFAVTLLAAAPARADEPLEVLVEGERPRAARDRTAASFVLHEDELRAPGATTAELLARAPGVQVTRVGASPDLATAQVRGASGAQTPVYLAGVRLNDEVTGVADLSTVPLAALARIEVYRGVVPLFADRSAIGGAIVLEPRLADRPGAAAAAAIGSFGEASLSGRLDAAGLVGGVRARASTLLRLERSDNDYAVRDDRGTPLFPADDRTYARPNADALALELLHVSRLERAGVRASFVVSAIAREQGVTGLSVIPAREARAALSRLLGGATVRVPWRALGQRFWFELGASGLAGRIELRDPARELSLLAARVSTEGLRGGVSGRVGVEIASRARLELGASVESELLSIDRDASFAARARRASARLGLGAAVRIVDGFDVVGMAALDCQTTSSLTPEGGARGGDACGLLEPTARLGVRAQPAPPLTLFANLSRAFRAPTLGELFGTSAILRGNPDLRREEAIGADVGARLAGEAGPAKGELEVFAFGRLSDELIAFQRSSLGVVRPFNAATARTLGLEASAALRLFGAAELSLAATLLDPRDTSAGGDPGVLLPYQAQVVVVPSLGAWFRPAQRRLLSRVGASTRVVYRGARVADRAGLVRIPDQASWDVEASGAFFGGALALRVAARNLLDQGLFDVVGFPLPGRSFHASIEGGLP